MKEIEFRGKRLDNGKWIYGYYSYNSGRNIHMITEDNAGTNIVSPETVGQYIGLKDKNGFKIYEGDAIRDEDGCFFIVAHNKEKAAYVLLSYGIATYDVMSLDDFEPTDEWAEVFGNIHDNPESLEIFPEELR